MDLTTIGIKVGWAVEAEAGTRPAAFTWIPRCTKIGGIKITNDKIDMTAFEDTLKQYAKGVGDTGGDWAITFNGNTNIKTQWAALYSAYTTAKATNKATWFDVYIPNFGSYFIKAEPGELPMSDLEVSTRIDLEMSLTINSYEGLDTGVEPTA